MPIATDIRSYVDSAQDTASEFVAKRRGEIEELNAKLKANADEVNAKLKASLDDMNARLEATVAPYVDKLHDYRGTVGDRADDLVDDLRKNPQVVKAEGWVGELRSTPQVAKALDWAGELADRVGALVQQQLVRRAKALAGRNVAPVVAAAKLDRSVAEPVGTVPAAPVAAAAPASTPKAASTKATTKPPTRAKKAPGTKTTSA